jgi:hypothetical protein
MAPQGPRLAQLRSEDRATRAKNRPMLARILRLIPSARSASISVPTSDAAPPGRNIPEDIHYPPRDPGLPVQPAEVIVRTQQELLDMLRLHAALTPAQFETRFGGPIGRLAERVNVLPGSASAAFAGAGGLFRAALETAVACFRASDGRIFTGALGVEARHLLEPRWRYLCFVAGLLLPLGRPLREMLVVDAAGAAWSPELDPLTSWAGEHRVTRLFAAWHSANSVPGPGALTATFALAVIGRENVEWLNRGSPVMVRMLLHIVSDRLPKGPIAGAVVDEAWQAVLAREQARCKGNWRRVTIGTQVLPYLLDALVALSRGAWLRAPGMLLADDSAIYLAWPEAGRDIIGYCRTLGTPGIPQTEAALLALLVDVELVLPGVEGTGLMLRTMDAGHARWVVQVAQPELMRADAPAAPASAPSTPQQQPPSSNRLAKANAATQERAVDADSPGVGGRDCDSDANSLQSTDSVSLAGKLPPDISAALRPHHANILAELVLRWREQDTQPAGGMRRCLQGAAFELATLSGLCSDPPAFLSRLAEVGLLYVAPNTSGKLVYPLPSNDTGTGGSADVTCFILARHAMKRLGLS